MSPRAAWRLASLGFEHVLDYTAGKSDWLAHALPYEGSAVLAARVMDVAVLTCDLGDSVDTVRERLDASPLDLVAVTNDQGVLLGTLEAEAADGAGDRTVAEVMTEGPTTIRASEEVGPLVERMQHASVEVVLVTAPDGRLLGAVDRDRAHRALHHA